MTAARAATEETARRILRDIAMPNEQGTRDFPGFVGRMVLIPGAPVAYTGYPCAGAVLPVLSKRPLANGIWHLCKAEP